MIGEYKRKLEKLGCAYNLDSMTECPDLEETIIQGLRHYWESNDLFFMLYGLLFHRVGRFVFVERLVKMLKEYDLTNDELILLHVLSSKLVNIGYEDFKKVLEKVKLKTKTFKTPPESESNSYMVERWGFDPEFKKFGAVVRTLPLEDKKKFYSLDKIFKHNKWLSLRSVVGANNRADILYLKTEGLVTSANQAFPILKCSKETAYRNWNSVESVIKLTLNIKSHS